MALELVPHSQAAQARRTPIGAPRRAPRAPSVQARSTAPSIRGGDFGYTPAQLHSAYALPTSSSSAQTIALVDVYNDPDAAHDLGVYDSEFDLPACTTANGCFEQVNQRGETSNLPFPASASELKDPPHGRTEEAEEATRWGVEISLDIETAHAICQSCHILLVEASAPYGADLEAAEQTAEAMGADEISNSWGGPEEGETVERDNAGPFNDPGTVITAAAGDSGYLGWQSPAEAGWASYPASSPHVVAVGGTRLELGAGGSWHSETVWNGAGASGGGCSQIFTAPEWQRTLGDWESVGCGTHRAVSDVAADADPYTGVAVADSTSPQCEYSYTEGGVEHVTHWCTIGGTSLASPLIAGVFALAGGAHGVSYPARTLYEGEAHDSGALHDITVGSNGECSEGYGESGLSDCSASVEAQTSCSGKAICLAGVGYDGPSGVGTPDGLGAFTPGSSGSEGGSSGAGEQGASGNPGAPGESGESGSGSPGSSGSGSGDGQSSGESAGSAGDDDGSGESSGNQIQQELEEELIELEAEESETSPAHGHASGSSSISGLTLDLAGTAGAADHAGELSDVVFSFTAASAGKVHVTLYVLSSHRRSSRWRRYGRTLTLLAKRGHDSGRLATGKTLKPGEYRLTVKPARGPSRTISFRVR